jgi:thiol reductant ABC exporter CydC subunit
VSTVGTVVRSPADGARLLVATLLAALTSLAAVALMGLSAWLISRAAEHPDASALTLAAVGVRALGLGRGVFRYAERLVGHSVTLRVVADLRVSVFQGLVDRPAFGLRSGQLLSAVVSDVDAVQDLLLRCLLPFASAAVVVAVCSTAAGLMLPAAGVVVALGLMTALLLLPALGFAASRADRVRGRHRADYQSAVHEVLLGCADLTVLGQLAVRQDELDRAAAGLAVLERRTALRSALLGGVAAVVQGATVLVLTVVAVRAVAAGVLPRTHLAVLVLGTLAAFEVLAPLADAGTMLSRTWTSVRRVVALVGLPREARPARAHLPRSVTAVEAAYTFPDRAEPSVRGLSVDLRPGRRIAMVGASGSGKSTCLRLLAGQLTASSGAVRCGDVPAADLDEADRARVVVLAEQAAHLFSATVEDNLRLARPDATAEQLRLAVAQAGLLTWLDALPAGLRTPVGAHGAQLSGGERKRLMVARALLSPAPVVLLDEPTEGLDPEAADALVRALVGALGQRSLLLVTHRLVALEAFDEILVLDRGEVVQRGTYDELARTPGAFHELHRQQVLAAV